MTSGNSNRSWFCFRGAILDRFKRKVLFNVAMQKLEARKWNPAAESFQDYAMDKLTLMRCLKLEDLDSIQLLITGINNISIKGVAASLRANSLNQFLREMQYITDTCGDSLKRLQPPNKFEITKDSNARFDKLKVPPERDNQQLKIFKRDTHCVYCHSKDHIRVDCPKLLKKEQRQKATQPPQPHPIAAVERSSEDLIACVHTDTDRKIVTDDSIVNISSINGISCNFAALIDTGSPISLINFLFFGNFLIHFRFL